MHSFISDLDLFKLSMFTSRPHKTEMPPEEPISGAQQSHQSSWGGAGAAIGGFHPLELSGNRPRVLETV